MQSGLAQPQQIRRTPSDSLVKQLI